MMAGFDHATGDIIVPIDADLQNDPADIPPARQAHEGYDVVSGWRKDRQDAAIRRNFVSRVANRLISRLSGVHLHDYGCSLKAYRREVIERRAPVRRDASLRADLRLVVRARIYRDPGQPQAAPARQIQLRARAHRQGRARPDGGAFLDRGIGKPIYLFRRLRPAVAVIAAASFRLLSLYLKFFVQVSMILTPLPLLAGHVVHDGVMSICMGLVAEIVVRTYFESQGKSIYHVRDADQRRASGTANAA